MIQVVSSERRILPQLIEKVYWIMHVLYGLAAQGFVFELKGGTSLSKGIRIEREPDETLFSKHCPSDSGPDLIDISY